MVIVSLRERRLRRRNSLLTYRQDAAATPAAWRPTLLHSAPPTHRPIGPAFHHPRSHPSPSPAIMALTEGGKEIADSEDELFTSSPVELSKSKSELPPPQRDLLDPVASPDPGTTHSPQTPGNVGSCDYESVKYTLQSDQESASKTASNSEPANTADLQPHQDLTAHVTMPVMGENTDASRESETASTHAISNDQMDETNSNGQEPAEASSSQDHALEPDAVSRPSLKDLQPEAETESNSIEPLVHDNVDQSNLTTSPDGGTPSRKDDNELHLLNTGAELEPAVDSSDNSTENSQIPSVMPPETFELSGSVHVQQQEAVNEVSPSVLAKEHNDDIVSLRNKSEETSSVAGQGKAEHQDAGTARPADALDLRAPFPNTKTGFTDTVQSHCTVAMQEGTSKTSSVQTQSATTNPAPQPSPPSIPQPLPAKSSQETTLSNLKAQRTALLASLAVLPAVRDLITESHTSTSTASLASHLSNPDTEPSDPDIMAAANKLVKQHIKLLHEYNEIKDVGQGLMGLIADQRGVRIVEVQDEFGISSKD